MIRLIHHSDIDKDRWNDCISRSLNRRVYAYSWYLDLLCANSWDALIEGDFEAVFPIPHRKKYGIAYVYTPFFVQQLGVFSPQEITAEKTAEFLSAIPAHYGLVELNLNSGNPINTEMAGMRSQANYELMLTEDYDVLFNAFSENHRRNIQKATRSKIEIMTSSSPDRIIAHFRSGKGKAVKHWREKEYDLFAELLKTCSIHSKVLIKEAYGPQKEFLGGAIFILSDQRAIFIFSSAVRSTGSNAAMPFLIDRFIFEHVGTGLILDFEGSNDPGLARFYAGFGATCFSYPFFKRDSLPSIVKKVRNLVK
jgi:hypothetical protein